MTEKKKKLQTTLSFRTEAPPGYIFVAAGDPKITSKCKELSRAQGVKVYIVSTSKNNNLSEQVGRVGYHFPRTIVDHACRLLGVKLGKSSNVHLEQEPRQRFPRHAKACAQGKRFRINSTIDLVEDEMSQNELNFQAASTIRELFPKIPDKDVQLIVARAFKKGKATVGTAKDQPFIRRVHLAVGAHIRHVYTDYDSLLKSKRPWIDARAMVQPHTLDKILEWRDEKDEPDAVEDILREVIVIPDDDDEESQDEMINDRQNSVEVISSHEFADTIHVQPLDYGALDERARFERPVSPEDDWAPSVKFIRRISTPPGEIQARHQERADRQQAHRVRIWQEAVSRRRDTAYTTHDPYRLREKGPASSNYTYSQPASSAYQAHGTPHGTQSRLTERRPVYANGSTEQPLMPKRYLDGSISQKDRNVEDMRPRQGFRRAEVDPLIGAYSFTKRPDYPAYVAHKRFEQVSNESHQHPRFTYPDSEDLIPSVEDAPPHVPHGQEALLHLGRAEPSNPHYQDRFVGPRIVELDDGPKTPTLKRRRSEDVVWPSAEVAYQPMTHTQSPRSALVPFRPSRNGGNPFENDVGTTFSQRFQYDQGPPRHVELVPTWGLVRDGANDGFKSAVIQHHDENIVYETSTSQRSPETAPRRGDTFAQSSDPYGHVRQPSVSRMAEHRTVSQDREVVYITSSPPTGERYTDLPKPANMTHYRPESHSHYKVEDRRGTQDRQIFHPSYRNSHQLYHDPRGPGQAVLLN
ncbi:MAG: hypothetical protein Q9223_000944 [Gallowayella weberi]